MENSLSNDVRCDMQRTVSDASGNQPDHITRFMEDVDAARAKYANDPSKYYQFAVSTMQALDQNGRSTDISVALVRQTLKGTEGRQNTFDLDGDGRYNLDELMTGAANPQADTIVRMAMARVANNYEQLKQEGGGGFLFIPRPDSLSTDDLKTGLENRQHHHEEEQAASRSRELMAPLMRSSSDSPSSLFDSLDNIKGGDRDGKVGLGDVEEWLDKYPNFHGAPPFTPQNRQVVEQLKNGWESPEVVRLRGTHASSDDAESGGNSEEPNWYMTPESLARAGGFAGPNRMRAAFVEQPAPSQPTPESSQTPYPPEITITGKSTPIPDKQYRAIGQVDAGTRVEIPSDEALAKLTPDQVEALANQLAHQKAMYTIKPGQGFDAIAHAVSKETGSNSDGQTLLSQSDQIARLNGCSGRLDDSVMLHPGRSIRVHDQTWEQKQAAAELAKLQARYDAAHSNSAASENQSTSNPVPETDEADGDLVCR